MVANNGPCYGEVGNGERFRTQVNLSPYIVLKSCTHCFLQGIPKKMKELEFAHVMMVGTAANMAVYVLRDTEEEDQAMISDHLCAPEKYKTDGGVQTFYDHRKKWKSLKPWIRRIWSTLRRGRGSVKLNLTS